MSTNALGITRVETPEQAESELAKLLPGTPVFARRTWRRFPCEVGYKTHSGHGVSFVVLGRGRTFENALNNAEVRVSRGRWHPPSVARRKAERRAERERCRFTGDLFD